jgi:hypothetical protein
MRFPGDYLPLNIAHDIRDIPPLRFLRFLTKDPGALSFQQFCRDVDPLPPCRFRRISKATIFFSSLLGVTTFTQGLPVVFVPEELPVTAMGFDVVHLGCRGESSFPFAVNTQGMHCKKLFTGLSPLIGVHLGTPIVLYLHHFFPMLLTISIMGQGLTPRIVADALWFPGHQSHLPISFIKKV